MANPHTLSGTLDLADWSAANLPIRYFGDPILYQACTAFENDEFGGAEMQHLADQLTATLTTYRHHAGMGRGLAANQIGTSRRMVVIWLDGPQCIVNPQALKLTGRGIGWESCLSSGTMLIGQVIRPWTGTFEYYTVDGQRHEYKADQGQTRLLLHEIDHLDGNICTDIYEAKTMRFITGGSAEVLGYELNQLFDASPD